MESEFTVPDAQWIDDELLAGDKFRNDELEGVKNLFDGFECHDDFGDDETSDSGTESTISGVDKELITDQEIETVSVQELNKLLRRLPGEDAKRIRRRRRNLKNRGYALTCRHRRQQREEDMMKENEMLKKLLEESNEELRKVSKEKQKFKEKFLRLLSAINAD